MFKVVDPTRRRMQEIYAECKEDIFAFCNYMGVKPVPDQVRLLQCIQDQLAPGLHKPIRRFAVKSGQGTGKTNISNVIGGWRAFRAPNSTTIVTAPTQRQCKEIWLREFDLILQKAHPLLRAFFDVRATKVVLGGADKQWEIRTETAVRAEGAQGVHDANLSYIVEEASGVKEKIIQTIYGTLTNKNSFLLMIGNPNEVATPFYKCFQYSQDWKCLTFSALNSPITDKDNIDRLRREFGENSDVWRVRVIGEFPLGGTDTVVGIGAFTTATEYTEPVVTELMPVTDKHYKYQIGIDLARFGDDESAVYARKNGRLVYAKNFAQAEPLNVCFHAMQYASDEGFADADTIFVVDGGGMGQSCIKVFLDAKKNVYTFNFNGSPLNSRYADKVTEAYFSLNEYMKNSKVYIPMDNILMYQLISRKYKVIDKKGKTKIKLVDKEEHKKEFGTSPDRADALAMCFYPIDKQGKGIMYA